MTDLVEFLKARLNEDEQTARAVPPDFDLFDGTGIVVMPANTGDRSISLPSHVARFAARFNPARELAEVEAKRRTLERHPGATKEDACPGCGAWLDGTWRTGPGKLCPELADLALPHAEHPDYREEWRP